MAFWDSEEVLAEVEKGDERIFVKRVSEGSRTYIDVRTFWLDDDDEWETEQERDCNPDRARRGDRRGDPSRRPGQRLKKPAPSRGRAFSLATVPHFPCTLAHESLSETVRLKTSFSLVESGSTQK